ncbi:MAG: vWA domain-containing protein [Bacteroidota bacterium]
MQKIQIMFESSPWLIVPALVVGVVYALLLYLKGKKLGTVSWGKTINYVLAGLRFVLVSLLCLLIVGPFIKQIRNTIEEPIVVFAIDNSASVAAVGDSARWVTEVANLQGEVQQQDYQVEVQSFSTANVLEAITFSEQRSDIEGLLSTIETEYEGRNLASVVLVSDGIYNEGISPVYSTYPFRIHAVGVGDTIPKQDLKISNLYYNKIAYQGNKFPLVAEISNTGFNGQSVAVSVSYRGKTLANEQVTFKQSRGVTNIEFLLEASEEGMSHYVVEVEALDGEFTQENNVSHAYIEIIEGKESILLVAQSPHPDIKALKLAIEQNKNYEVETAILGLEPWNPAMVANNKFDLVILHQIPGRGLNDAQLSQLVQDANALWYIVGRQSNIPMLNRSNDLIEIISQSNETDEVRPVFNEGFSGFQLENTSRTIVEDYLPLEVPFGKIDFKGETTTLLYQQVGNVKTNQPLLVIGEVDDKKQAILMAEGIWKWRLQEYATSENTLAFDALFTKLVQFLSAKEDKRRFKVYPVRNEFEDTEPVVFETEIYNDIYEEVYGQTVNLQLTSEAGEQRDYSYATNENNTQYRIGNLPEGVYSYRASVDLNDEQLTSEGEFSVQRLEIETLNLTADHGLLRELAQASGGQFTTVESMRELNAVFQNQESPSKIYTSEAFLPIINLKWLFFLLLLLVAVEWGIRKYMGSY